MKRALLALAMLAAGALPLSCGVNDYCLGCPVAGDGGGGGGDGGGGDGGDAGDGGIVPGIEVCDNKDNDCDENVDEAPLPEIGSPCANQMGECQGAVKQCAAGVVTCTKEPSAETCDLKDNNCNGMVDEGNPGGGASCGTDVGECVAGVNSCMGGMVVCVGAIGGGPETCNGRDDDCDTLFDEGLMNLGSCGMTDVGECTFGTLMCMGGGQVCVGATGPTFEICDMLDQDCDGNPTNGFDLATDPTNCGMCGNVCNLPNAFEACAGGMCAIAACQPGYHDNDGMPGTGCESGRRTIQSTVEVCNGADDNCNNMIDEGVPLPPAATFCQTAGECAAGTTVSCDGAMGVRCHIYNDPDVSTDVNGNIVAETLCDGLDNDCDGAIDEGQPNKDQACDNGLAGDCRDTGTFQCNTAMPNGPAVCVITQQGPGNTGEVCDGRDNDCNGTIDDNASTGDMPGQEWVTIPGSTVEIMKYEASRPDATATGAGAQQAHACARAGVQPWTNLTYPQAVQACLSVNARLCTEDEWHRMCAPQPEYPVAGPAVGEHVFLEAEDAFANVTVAGRTWAFFPPYQDSSGPGYVLTTDSGVTITAANAPSNSARLDFRVNLAAATYVVWVRMMGSGGGSDSVWVGINPTQPGTAVNFELNIGPDLTWRWVPSSAITIATAGTYFTSVYMREDGTVVDAIAIARQGMPAPTFDENTWAYATNRKTAQPQACNGDAYDTTPGGADDDGILPTGSMPMCYADGPGAADAYDMSGNVKEWTAARAQGQNPIRGGASNNEVVGLTCGLDFTLANDTFFFPNVGFRCCR